MATSGTVGQTVITAQDLIDSAVRRCNKLAEEVTSEIQLALKQDLFFLLTNLVNRGIQMWTISKLVLGMIPEGATYAMPLGTIEVLNVLYRIPLTVSGSPIASSGTASNAFDQNVTTTCDAGVNGWIGTDFGSGNTQYVTSIGFMPNGTRTLSLVLEYSQDTVTWVAMPPASSMLSSLPTAATSYVDGGWTFWDLDPGVAARAYRVRETAGGDLNVREILMMGGENEIPIYRLNRDDYANLPNKHLLLTTPPQAYVQRTLNSQNVTVWGVPQNAFYQLVFWYHRQLQDVGSLSNQIEVPQRWYKAIRDQLAVDASFQLKDVDPQRTQFLQALAKESIIEAEAEERDKSPIMFTPAIQYYTR